MFEFEIFASLYHRRITCQVSDRIRPTRARIPAQSKASLFRQKDFKFLKFEFNLHYCDMKVWNYLRGHLTGTYPKIEMYIFYSHISSSEPIILLGVKIFEVWR